MHAPASTPPRPVSSIRVDPAPGSVAGAALAVDARSLARRTRAELDALFTSLPAPPLLDGDLRGVQIDFAGLERLPRAVRGAILAALRGPLGLWRGKRLAGARGTNVW